MRKNEPVATRRIARPIPFYDLDGALKSGLAFGGAGETALWDPTSGTFNDTTADASEIGATGMYQVQLQQGEVNYDDLVIVRLRKSPYADQFLPVPIDRIDIIFDDPNHVLDKFVYDGTTGFLTSCRKRIFASAAAATAATTDALDNADGEVARFLMTAVDNGDVKPERVQWVRDL